MLWKGLSQRRCVWWNPFKNKLLVHIHTLRVVHGYTKKLELAEGQIQIGSKCLSSCASGPFDTKTLPWKYLKNYHLECIVWNILENKFGSPCWVIGESLSGLYATIQLYAIGLQESETASSSILNCLKESPQIFSTCYSAVISHLSAAVKGAVSLTWYWSLSHQEPRNEVRSPSLTKSSVGFGPVTFQFQCNALPHQATPPKGSHPKAYICSKIMEVKQYKGYRASPSYTSFYVQGSFFSKRTQPGIVPPTFWNMQHFMNPWSSFQRKK